MLPTLAEYQDLPSVSLGSEHFFDESVIRAILDGQGLPYRAEFASTETSRDGGGILIEFHDLTPMPIIERQLFELQTRGYLPVLAHPERYRAVWKEPDLVTRLVERGCVALLDTAALAGKYGSRAKGCARKLMEMEAYDAACSDAHRPADAKLVHKGMKWIESSYGSEEIDFLFSTGPRALLEGKRPAHP